MTKTIRHEVDLNNLPPLTDEQKAEIKALEESPDIENTWDSFFLSKDGVSDDFMKKRATQKQSERESF